VRDGSTVRILVAGIGNIFLGDDGFGVEVASRLASTTLPDGVRVADFGIRGIHLAYELLDGGYDTIVLVDAVTRGGAPGTIYLIEPDLERVATGGAPDAHGMTPEAVLGMLRSLGGHEGRVLIVGCEPASVDEGIGLSEPVTGAVEDAVSMIVAFLTKEAASPDARRPRAVAAERGG
jgi:hydrogenase maturation protease